MVGDRGSRIGGARGGLWGAGRGPYHGKVVRFARRSPSTLLVALSWSLACAGGTDDSGASGLSIGVISQGSQAGEETGSVTSTGEGGGGETFAPTTVPPPDDSGVPTTNDPSDPMFVCGDGVLDPNEECDGSELDAQTCDGFGFDGGTLLCSPECAYDTSMCDAAAVCGDGLLDVDTEECDCGNGQCTAAQLGNVNCMALPSPKGTPYSGGPLSCNPQTCTLNQQGCTYCGDGIRNGNEPCEAGDLGGQSCASQGFDAGNLACTPDCAFNNSGCKTFVCGDGTCDAGEDSCSCFQDCPDNPNSCSPCECGFQGGPTCYCDVNCVFNFDCCQGGPCF